MSIFGSALLALLGFSFFTGLGGKSAVEANKLLEFFYLLTPSKGGLLLV